MEFAYVRVSTTTQTTDSQVTDILKAYPSIEISIDVCSGTVPAIEREQLSRLLDKLRKDDVLIVWWIDRLGRDYHDSETTIRELLNRGVTIKTINQNMTFAYSGNAAIAVLTEAAVKVSPTGKQNSFTSRAYASYVMAEKGQQ